MADLYGDGGLVLVDAAPVAERDEVEGGLGDGGECEVDLGGDGEGEEGEEEEREHGGGREGRHVVMLRVEGMEGEWDMRCDERM